MLCSLGVGTCAEENLLNKLEGILGDALSLDDYEIRNQEEESLRLSLIDGEYIELDDRLTVGNVEITLPMLYGSFVDAGWVSETQWVDPTNANSFGSGKYTNAEVQTVYVKFVNPTQQAQELVKEWFLSVQAGGDYTAEFDVKGVHAVSTLTETVAAWGKP